MKNLIYLFPALIAMLLISNCDKNEPDEITDFAYPPEEMLRYYDFPEGSWWAYKCLNDSTVDTFRLYEKNAPGRLRADDFSGGAFYKTAVFGFAHINENNILSLDSFGYALTPFGEINPNDENSHKYFKTIMNPFKGQFNPHDEMYFPISDNSYSEALNNYRYINDTTISEKKYPEVLLLLNTWEAATIPIYVEDKYYVKDIGIVKYTLSNDYEYELIDYSINP